MSQTVLSDIIKGVKDGQVIPYLGPYALTGSVHKETGTPIPADSDSLILAMNNGEPMAPVLMLEFSRAAMNRELKYGRTYVSNFLTDCYGPDVWTRTPIHDWLAAAKPAYVIDINRDTLLQTGYADTEHNLILGLSRLKGYAFRFKIFHYNGTSYQEIDQEAIDPSLPILFKPHGSPAPEPNYVATDADFVDYLTELRGGFGVPAHLKQYRQEKQYLFLGVRFTKDTIRMVMADIALDAAQPIMGWALIPEPTKKEIRYCARMGIEIIDAEISDFLAAAECPGEGSLTSILG
jgi:hypothetical protein